MTGLKGRGPDPMCSRELLEIGHRAVPCTLSCPRNPLRSCRLMKVKINLMTSGIRRTRIDHSMRAHPILSLAGHESGFCDMSRRAAAGVGTQCACPAGRHQLLETWVMPAI